jgi:hypothetical protein
VSGEAESAIQSAFVDKLGAKYPLVQIKAQDAAVYGIRGYPSVYVIDANGVVHSTPDENMPGDAAIEELLKDVSLPPELPADPAYDPLRALRKKGDPMKLREHVAKALAAPALDAAMRDVLTAEQAHLQQQQERAIARVTQLGAGPDYAASEDQLDALAKKWKGLPPADAAAKEKARLVADPAIKTELAAGRALQKLLASHDVGKVAQKNKLIDALGAFQKKYEGTHAAGQAAQHASRLAGDR